MLQLPSRLRTMLATPAALAWWAAMKLKIGLPRQGKRPEPRHLLLVCWDYPPSAATGAHVPASLVRYAALAKWRVTVVCAPAPELPSDGGLELAASIPAEVRVHRVSRFLATEHSVRLHPAWFVPSIDGGYLNALALASTAIDRLAADPPAVVLASGPRFANFLAARWLADAFGAKLVLHYRDEWTVNPPIFIDNTANDREEETRCLARADLVSFVSEGKASAYREAFPAIDPAKFLILPNGWEPYFHRTARWRTRHLPPGKLTLTFTGRWHASLQPLLDAFDKALERHPELRTKLCLVMLGRQLPANDELLHEFAKRNPHNILTLPATSPAAAIEVQRESSVLLLLNEHIYDGIVPLKTFDYLCGRRPILVFGRTGGAAKIVQGLGAGIVVAADDSDAFGDALIALLKAEEPWTTPQRRAWCASRNRKLLTAKMLAAISDLTPPRHAPAHKLSARLVGPFPTPASRQAAF